MPREEIRNPSSTTTGTKTARFKGNCCYCRKKGHKEVDCRKKKRDSKAGNVCNETRTSEVMLCGFCKDSNMYKKDPMYELVDSLEARLKI